MGDVARHNDGAVQAQARGDGVLAQFFQNFLHRAVQVNGDSFAGGHAQGFRNILAGVGFQLFNKDALRRDLGFRVAVRRAGDSQANRAGGAVAGQPDNAHVQSVPLAAELGAQAQFARFFMQFLFQFQVTEGAAVFVPRSRQIVVVLRGSHLHGLQAFFRRGSANDESDVIGRAGRRAQSTHLFHQELFQRGRVEQGLRFLVKVSFVGGAAALGDEQEGVFHALHRFQVNLGGKVGAGVFLRVHIQRHRLGIAQVVLGIGVVNAVGKLFAVVTAGPYLLALFAYDGGGSCVLAEGQDAGGRHFRVAEHRQGHAFIIVAGFRIVQNGGHLLQVGGAQEKGHVMEGFRCQQAQSLRFHFQHGVSFKVAYAHIV